MIPKTFIKLQRSNFFGPIYILLLATIFAFYNAAAIATESNTKMKIIAESIRSYRGNCPCPYNVAKNGSKCGGRSAYSRAGGASPLCYENDITQEMVKEYKSRNK